MPQDEAASHTARERTGAVSSHYPLARSSYGFCHHEPLNLWGDDVPSQDAQQWALAVAVILEEWMKRMSHSTSHWWSISHQCSSSQWCSATHRRSRSSGWWKESPQVTPCLGETDTKPDSSQANSCWEGMVDIDFFKHQRMSQVTSHWGAPLQNKPSHPAPQGDVRWHSPESTLSRGESKMWGEEMPMWCWGRNGLYVAPHQCGRQGQHQKRWPIGPDQERRLKPSQTKKI